MENENILQTDGLVTDDSGQTGLSDNIGDEQSVNGTSDYPDEANEVYLSSDDSEASESASSGSVSADDINRAVVDALKSVLAERDENAAVEASIKEEEAAAAASSAEEEAAAAASSAEEEAAAAASSEAAEDAEQKKNIADIQSSLQSISDAISTEQTVQTPRQYYNGVDYTDSLYAYTAVPDSNSFVVSQDNQLDYSNDFAVIVFALGAILGILFGKCWLWR